MALAYGSFNELSHQLRFLLFEIGIGLHQQHIDYYITVAHKNCLKMLQQAAIEEGLISSPITSHHVHDFLEQLRLKLQTTNPASRFFTWDKLYYHCNESIANNALAYAYKNAWNNRLNQELQHYPSLWAWLKEQRSDHVLSFLEQWGCKPTTLETSWHKTKGYTRRETLQYSPEFQAQFSIHWLAVRKREALITPTFDQVMKHEFAREYSIWQEKLSLHHVPIDDYCPLPAHPWVWRSLQTSYAPLLDIKDLILLPHHQKVMPAMASDTFMPLHSNMHLKLTVDKESHLKQKLCFVLAQEQHYKDTLFVRSQLGALILQPHSLANVEPLGISLLQSPTSLIHQQKAIPLLSLFSLSPRTNTCLIDELIKESTLNPLDYFIKYCQKIMFGFFHLFFKHGLSFTVSPEEVALIFHHSIPQGLILGDVSHIYLPGQKHETNSLGCTTLLIKHLHRGLLHNNIRYWIAHLNTEYHIESTILWSKVKGIINDIFARFEQTVPLEVLNEKKRLLFSKLERNNAMLSKYLIPHLTKSTALLP